MTEHTTRSAVEPIDVRRIVRMSAFVRQATIPLALTAVAGRPPSHGAAGVLMDCCRLSHGAVTVFPASVAGTRDVLVSMGFLLGDTVPSVVVRDRLRRRYQVAELEVSLIHASIPASRLGEGHLELFLVPDQASDTRHIAAGERFGEDEAHLAFEAITPGPTLLQDLRRLVISECELRPDGGGYNPLDDSNGGGRTVLYFTAPARPGTQSWVHRLELTCSGHYPDVIDQHLDESTKADPLTPVPVRACTPPRSLVTGGA